MGINFGGVQVLVAQNLLHRLYVHAVLQHQRGRRVPQLVAGIFFAVQPGGGEVLFKNGQMVGAVGISGGTAQQDTKLGEFAKNIFENNQIR